MDWLVLMIGVIIITAAALLLFISGMRLGKAKVIMEYKDSVSLRGLSQPSREFVTQTVARRHIWEEKRGPNKHLFKPVHYD